MSRSSIRILTTTDGINVLKQILETDDFGNTISDLMDKASINMKYNQFIYLGWERLSLSQSSLIKNVIIELEEQDISYRLAEIHDEIAETEELYYTSKEDENKFFPYLYTIHTFDDTEMITTLEKHTELEKNRNEETIEYE